MVVFFILFSSTIPVFLFKKKEESIADDGQSKQKSETTHCIGDGNRSPTNYPPSRKQKNKQTTCPCVGLPLGRCTNPNPNVRLPVPVATPLP